MADSLQVQLARAIASALNELGDAIYEANKIKGFWPSTHEQGQESCLQQIMVYDPETKISHSGWARLPARNFGEILMLAVSELVEALEAHRKIGLHGAGNYGLSVSHVTEELADTIIRLLDTARGLDLPLGEALAEKLAYNDTRPPKHGKAY